MALNKFSSSSTTTGYVTPIPAGLGFINECSFAGGGLSAGTTDAANYGGRNATAIAFGNNIFIMFGSKGAHAWSHNGSDWFSGKGPLEINQGRYQMDYVTDAVYSSTLSLWVAVTRLGRIFTGTDQHTWTERTSPFSSSYINKVKFGNGYFVAVANSGKFAYSTNGINWTLSNNAAFSSIHDIYALVYAAGSINKWIMAGTNGRMAYSTSNVPTSWTTVTSGFGTHTTGDGNSNVYDIGFNGTTLLSVGGNGRFSTSLDGVFWDAKTQVSGSPELHRVVWAASTAQWVAASANATSSYWSATGNTFNASTTTYNTNYFGRDGSNNDRNQTIPIGTDGQTKVLLMTYNGGDQILQYTTSTSFTNNNNRVVNFGKVRQDDASNPDSWQMTALPVGYGNLEMIAKGTNKILAFLSQKRLFGGFHFMESIDNGVTWYSAAIKVDPTGTGANLGIGSGPASGTGTKLQIAFLKIINGVWFMGASNGTVYTSVDGEIWLSEFNVGSQIPVTVEYGNNWYICISTDNQNFYRTNGVPNKTAGGTTTWTQLPWTNAGQPGNGSPSNQYYAPKFVKWCGDKWVGGWTSTQTLYHSADNCQNWRSIDGNPADWGSYIGDRGSVWGNSTYVYTSTSTQMGDDFIFDYNNGIAIASAANGQNSSNSVINLAISNNLQSWSHHYGMNGRTYDRTNSGFLWNTVETVVSTNDQFQSALGRQEGANFSTIPGERQHAFNNAQVPVVQVFGDIPMAWIGMTARRGDSSQGTSGGSYGGGSHGYIQFRNGMNLPTARGYFTRQTIRAYPISKFVQAGNRFFAIGYCDQDQGTQPRTSNAGYFGIYEVAAMDMTKI